MKAPHISIIVPIYNAQSYLEQCIGSVLAQTFTSFELILVDDGSLDNSPAICDAYAKKHSNVSVIHQKNGGQSVARKAGLAQAKAEYVMLIDADDWLEPNALEVLYQHASDNNADIVTCDTYFHFKTHKIQANQPVPKGTFDKPGLIEHIYPVMLYPGKFFYFGIFAAMWNKLFKKSILLPNIMNIDERVRIGEDGLATYGAFLDAQKACIIPDHLYNYRNYNNSITRTYARDQFDNAKLLIKSLRDINEKKGIFDFSSQIDYYYMYNVRSIFEEEFQYHVGRSWAQKWAYLAPIARRPDVHASCNRISTAGMSRWNQRFFSLLARQNVPLLIAATWLHVKTAALKSFVRRHLKDIAYR